MIVDSSFLKLLFGEVLTDGLTITRRALRHDRHDPKVAFYDSIQELVDDAGMAQLNAGGWSIYFGVGPRRNRDGTKEGCAGLPAFRVDLDAKDFGATIDEGKQSILETLQKRLPLNLRPSLLVDSGGGFQAYWLLREFAWIGGDWYTVDTLEGYLRGLQQHLGADPARTDVSSLLRLPGTINWKYPHRPECRVIHCDPERLYNCEDFDAHLIRNGAPRAAPNTSGWSDELLKGVDGPETRPSGEVGRDQAGTKLAGKLFRQGFGDAEVLTFLRGWNLRNRPPLPDEDLERIVRSIGEKHRRAGGAPSAAPEAAAPLAVPDEGMVGVGREFADLYGEYLESPRAFFYFAFLTYFGALVARKITLDSELRPQPRLYTVLLGESADTRKSTALRKVDEFFRSVGPEWEPRVLFGVGSAEGIAAELKECPDLILHFDELKAFVDKAKNEHSVALPMVSTLFERNDYDNRTKAERLSVRNAALSLVAACTADTYANIFDQKFLAIGFPNRLWLVSDRSTRRIAVPEMIVEAKVDTLRRRVRALLEGIDMAFRDNGSRPVPYRMTPGALEAFRAWYDRREGSIFERRLDTYAHRLLLLLAATSGKTVIDEDIAGRVVSLLRYQLDVRRESDPVDAENVVAAMEERIRRALARGAMKGRDLKRKVHYDRAGLWVWSTAIENLKRADEIAHQGKLGIFWLTTPDEAVTTRVTSDTHGVSAGHD